MSRIGIATSLKQYHLYHNYNCNYSLVKNTNLKICIYKLNKDKGVLFEHYYDDSKIRTLAEKGILLRQTHTPITSILTYEINGMVAVIYSRCTSKQVPWSYVTKNSDRRSFVVDGGTPLVHSYMLNALIDATATGSFNRMIEDLPHLIEELDRLYST